jgi:hypothetical protein
VGNPGYVRPMAKVSEDTIRAAMAPGVDKAQATFAAVAQDMAGRSADEVHDELVKRLEAEPFAWDDDELRKIAATIGDQPSDERS